PPLPIAKASLSETDLRVLAYFKRDLLEMLRAPFYKEGPGTLDLSGCEGSCTLHTAVTDDEIRSFVTIFRRLYMANEPSNFLKAVAVFAKATVGHPLGKWIEAAGKEYVAKLQRPPESFPLPQSVSFTQKRLIDVFLYTQYAHQPDDGRQRQFQECLQQLGGDRALLTFLFLEKL